jgi:hypothetical protein
LSLGKEPTELSWGKKCDAEFSLRAFSEQKKFDLLPTYFERYMNAPLAGSNLQVFTSARY